MDHSERPLRDIDKKLFQKIAGRMITKLASAKRDISKVHGIKIEQSITIARPPQELFEFWRNFVNLPHMMPYLAHVRVLDEWTSVWSAYTVGDQVLSWKAEIIEEKPNEMISWRSLPESEVPNAGSVWFRKAPKGLGTIVSVYLSFDPPGGKVANAILKLLGEDPQRQIHANLHRLKQYFEAGEVATVAGQPKGQRDKGMEPI